MTVCRHGFMPGKCLAQACENHSLARSRVLPLERQAPRPKFRPALLLEEGAPPLELAVSGDRPLREVPAPPKPARNGRAAAIAVAELRKINAGRRAARGAP